jgi:hypothetical protein
LVWSLWSIISPFSEKCNLCKSSLHAFLYPLAIGAFLVAILSSHSFN